jgi:hypothetical protein
VTVDCAYGELGKWIYEQERSPATTNPVDRLNTRDEEEAVRRQRVGGLE